MGASLMKNLKPFSRFIPGKPLSVNSYAVEKFGWSDLSEEISEYVLQDKAPKTPRLIELVNHYEKLHHESKRPQY